MADASIEDKVKNIIVEQLGVSEDQVKSEAKFVEDLGADSLDTVELVMAFEEEFDITVPDEDAEKLTSVGEVVSYIEAQEVKCVTCGDALFVLGGWPIGVVGEGENFEFRTRNFEFRRVCCSRFLVQNPPHSFLFMPQNLRMKMF